MFRLSALSSYLCSIWSQNHRWCGPPGHNICSLECTCIICCQKFYARVKGFVHVSDVFLSPDIRSAIWSLWICWAFVLLRCWCQLNEAWLWNTITDNRLSELWELAIALSEATPDARGRVLVGPQTLHSLAYNIYGRARTDLIINGANKDKQNVMLYCK